MRDSPSACDFFQRMILLWIEADPGVVHVMKVASKVFLPLFSGTRRKIESEWTLDP